MIAGVQVRVDDESIRISTSSKSAKSNSNSSTDTTSTRTYTSTSIDNQTKTAIPFPAGSPPISTSMRANKNYSQQAATATATATTPKIGQKQTTIKMKMKKKKNNNTKRKRQKPKPSPSPTTMTAHEENNNNNNKTKSNHDDRNKRPIILIGTYHKTGTVLAGHVFKLAIGRHSNLRVKSFCNHHHDGINKDNLLEELQDLDIATDCHWNFTLKDLQYVSNVLGRPYKFVQFVRNPLSIPVSAYSYHLKGSEYWLFQPEELAFNRRGGAMRDNWCSTDIWKQRCQEYGEYIPNLCHHHHQNDDYDDDNKTAVADPIDQLICNEYDVLDKELRNDSNVTRNSDFWNISHYDTLGRLNRLDGVRLEAVRSIHQLLDMAAVTESTKNDPNTLTVDLDIVVRNHKLCWSQILSFVGLDPAKYLKYTNKFEISHVSGTHITRNENKTDLQSEVKKPLVQKAYQPIISIMDQLDMTCHY